MQKRIGSHALRKLPLCLHTPPERVLAPQTGKVIRSNLLAATQA